MRIVNIMEKEENENRERVKRSEENKEDWGEKDRQKGRKGTRLRKQQINK